MVSEVEVSFGRECSSIQPPLYKDKTRSARAYCERVPKYDDWCLNKCMGRAGCTSACMGRQHIVKWLPASERDGGREIRCVGDIGIFSVLGGEAFHDVLE